jgi:hypothetical protein
LYVESAERAIEGVPGTKIADDGIGEAFWRAK